MEFLFEYLGFLARAVTIVVAIMVVLGFLFANASRRGGQEGAQGVLEVKHLNRELDDLKAALEGAVVSPEEQKFLTKTREAEEKKKRKAEAKAAKLAYKTAQKAEKQAEKRAEKQGHQSASEGVASTESESQAADSNAEAEAGKVFVLNFLGDLQASAVEQLRQEVTSVLTVATPSDEIVVRLESPGGVVHAYGLAASQLQRIRAQNIPLTATIDKVAASGGYMMAAVADKILAAPFAVVGSIGVVAQVPNVHRLLKKHDVDVELITAGEHKRTLTMLGENTDEGREKFTEQLEDIHKLFQEHVVAHRDAVDIKEVATGEAWYGQRAIDVKLVDRLITSDSYLAECATDREVYLLRWAVQKKPLERLLGGIGGAINRGLNNAWQQAGQGLNHWLKRAP